MNTFSYCGIPSDRFGCYYASQDTERFYDKADFEVYSEEPDWYDGAIYYGSSLKPREFELNCFYEDIDRRTKERMLAWLDRRTSGRLVFDHCPWKYYHVRPTKCLSGKEYTHTDGKGNDVYSGVFTIYFTAFEPWAYIDGVQYKAVNGTVSFFISNGWNLNVDTKIYEDDDFTPLFSINDDKVLYVISDEDHTFSTNGNRELIVTTETEGSSSEETNPMEDYLFDPACDVSITKDSRRFNLYNIGTEKTYPVIRIGGTAQSGLTITNQANGTVCGLTALPPSGGYLEIDCAHGIVYHVDGANKNVEFSYHDYGYISLEPCGIIDSGVKIAYASGSNIIQMEDRTYEQDAVGKYVILENTLFSILSETSDGYVISGRPNTSGTETATLFRMNPIVITGTDITLDMLEIEFTPRVQ